MKLKVYKAIYIAEIAYGAIIPLAAKLGFDHKLGAAFMVLMILLSMSGIYYLFSQKSCYLQTPKGVIIMACVFSLTADWYLLRAML